MRVVVTGDVVGPAGVALACERLAGLRSTPSDLVLVNADNASVSGRSPLTGSGLDTETRDALLEAGADLILTGSHAFDVPDSLEHPRVLRAANVPDVPGSGHALLGQLDVVQLAVRGSSATATPPLRWLRSQEFARPPLVHLVCDAPFVSTLFAHAVDGEVAAVVASMNHVPALRAELLPRGTALVCDVGYVGPSGGVGGFDVAPFLAAIERAEAQDALGIDLQEYLRLAEQQWDGQYGFTAGPPVFDAVAIELGTDGLARSVERL